MPAGYSELFMEQGASFNVTITLDDVNGQSYNLQNYSANSEIRKSYYSSNSVAVFTTSTSNTPSDGVLTLSLSYQQTSNIKPGRYVYDVYVTNTQEQARIRVLEGIINVTPSVTRI